MRPLVRARRLAKLGYFLVAGGAAALYAACSGDDSATDAGPAVPDGGGEAAADAGADASGDVAADAGAVTDAGKGDAGETGAPDDAANQGGRFWDVICE